MNRGLEIVRRLLLSCFWIIGSLLVTLAVVFSVHDYLDKVKEEPAINDSLEEFDRIDKQYGRNLSQAQAERQLKILNDAESYDLSKGAKKESMWISIGILLGFPFVGYGVHRLINWILVHKAEG